MESLIDRAAREMGLDRVEIRRLNQVQVSEMPYSASNGSVYDSGDFPGILDRVLELSDWSGFEARRKESEANGRIRGLGLAAISEATAGPMPESVGIRFEEDGLVSLITGTLDYGQGHAGTFAQVLAEKLGVPFSEKIRLIQVTPSQVPVGSGSGGSRSTMNSGAYVVAASQDVVEKGKVAACTCSKPPSPTSNSPAVASPSPAPTEASASWSWRRNCRGGLALPEGAPTTLDTTHIGKGVPATYPNGAHVCEVEIDPETGFVVRYVNVNDFGNLINPMLVEGQLQGGVAQGIGQAIMERVVYDEDGNLISGSFMDYAMPRADDIPSSSPKAARSRRPPTRSASRAAARAMAPARSPPSPAPSATPCSAPASWNSKCLRRLCASGRPCRMRALRQNKLSAAGVASEEKSHEEIVRRSCRSPRHDRRCGGADAAGCGSGKTGGGPRCRARRQARRPARHQHGFGRRAGSAAGHRQGPRRRHHQGTPLQGQG